MGELGVTAEARKLRQAVLYTVEEFGSTLSA
jgi:hypothetical protein